MLRCRPSQTRLDLRGKCYLCLRDGERIICSCALSGEITGAGVKEITELPLWPKNCVWATAGSHPAEDTGDFPVNCFIGRLLFACCFCRLKIEHHSCNYTTRAVNPYMRKNAKYNALKSSNYTFYCGLNWHKAAPHNAIYYNCPAQQHKESQKRIWCQDVTLVSFINYS